MRSVGSKRESKGDCLGKKSSKLKVRSKVVGRNKSRGQEERKEGRGKEGKRERRTRPGN